MSIRPHAFVAMPFGSDKKGPDGTPIDFNTIYKVLIAPAIEEAGLSAWRADQEQRAGDIRTDMFEELLMADLVVADLTIDNPNVWYELGVRHALRARGVVLISGGASPKAFDIYTDRKLRYGLAGGLPDPATLEADRHALAEAIRATMDAAPERKVSPVYSLMPGLNEPDWRSFRADPPAPFWATHDAWERSLKLALSEGRIGDLLVLAEEAPVTALRADAWHTAGAALRKADQYTLALDYLDRALDVEPGRLDTLREKGICIERLSLKPGSGMSLARARAHYEQILERHPEDTETRSLLGRVCKRDWTDRWRKAGRTVDQMRSDALDGSELLLAAADSYRAAFRQSPGHYFSGINAVTLMQLARHLVVEDERSTPEARERDTQLMAGAVRFAADSEKKSSAMYWAKVTLADLAVLDSEPELVRRAYKRACAVQDLDWFSLDSTRSQLQLLADLSFRPDAVRAALDVVGSELDHRERPDQRTPPRQVLLFSGHMMDAPDRPTPRFPPAMEPAAAAAIEAVLAQLDAGPADVALCQAAAGGDLLFLEACQRRGVRCQVLLPFEEPDFLRQSVVRSANGHAWRDRFFAVQAKLSEPMREMPEALGPAPKDVSPYERCNLWLQKSALALGIDKVRCVLLWDGGGSDGPGGTAHMKAEVERLTGRVFHIDTRTLAV